MKTGLHPEYTESKIVCSCGNEWVTRSTQAAIKV
ncbi:MAG: 50S ribosomal protein L31, partial [Dehalococcoidia bacterium]|nr:50S ribosomal protein L31 [Dehalococcoidia bacterium]